MKLDYQNPRHSVKSLENKELQAIVEHPNGEVEINFSTSKRMVIAQGSSSDRTPRSSVSSSIDDIRQPSGITLATYRDSYETSEADFTINTITLEETEEFQINKELLLKDFNSEGNKIKKEWFFKTFDQYKRSAVRTQ